MRENSVMTFEQAGGPAARIIEELARKIDRAKLAADAIAEKIASPDRERLDFARYEAHAEKAQRLAGEQAAWETLIDMGFVQ